MAIAPQANPGNTVGTASDRARRGLEQAAQTHLTAEPKDVVGAVSAVMALAADIGQLRVGCREDGAALTVRVGNEPEQEVELPRARTFLRMMCANLSVRSGRPDEPTLMYGGVAYLPPLQAGQPGFTLKLMNTMGEQWFDLAFQEVSARAPLPGRG